MTSLLIIDDNQEDLEWVAWLARDAGLQDVTIAATLKEGLARFRTAPTDVVILDDRMNPERGWAWLPSFKALGVTTRLIVVSGEAFVGAAQIAEKMGARFAVKSELSAERLKQLIWD